MYVSFLKIAPDGLGKGARLASGAFYCAVCLRTFYESIILGISRNYVSGEWLLNILQATLK